MSESPLVSIVIPTYKRGVRVLSRAVRSVQAQTYPNIELVVVDDSPSDWPEREEVRAFMEPLVGPRVLYVQNEHNLGGSLTRNRGCEVAHGEYISFLDDDDVYFPEKTEKQLAFTVAGGYDVTLTSIVMHNGREQVVDYREHEDISGLDQEGLLHYHLMRHLTGTSAYMFRREKLLSVGGFDDAKMGQEFYLMLKCIEAGFRVGYMPDCLVKMYKHDEGGITQGRNKIDGEIALHERKKAYFSRLSPKEIRFINFRHWAVMVVAYRRNRLWPQMLWAGVRALVASPLDFGAQVTGFFWRIVKNRRV